MALIKVKPTSPGRRSMIKVVNSELHKGDPYAPLLVAQKRGSGRNNNGHITTKVAATSITIVSLTSVAIKIACRARSSVLSTIQTAAHLSR
jgi:ribosomal protein L2